MRGKKLDKKKRHTPIIKHQVSDGYDDHRRWPETILAAVTIHITVAINVDTVVVVIVAATTAGDSIPLKGKRG